MSVFCFRSPDIFSLPTLSRRLHREPFHSHFTLLQSTVRALSTWPIVRYRCFAYAALPGCLFSAAGRRRAPPSAGRAMAHAGAGAGAGAHTVRSPLRAPYTRPPRHVLASRLLLEKGAGGQLSSSLSAANWRLFVGPVCWAQKGRDGSDDCAHNKNRKPLEMA